MSRTPALLLLALFAGPAGAEPAFERTEQREACATTDALRRPFFGDVHIHTALSLDASTQDTRNRPHDAYRFARGEPLGIQPYGMDARPLRNVRLARPLDFAAVTDHAEFFGEVETCLDAERPGYRSPTCVLYRWLPRFAFFVMSGDYMSAPDAKRYAFCGPDGARCREAARSPWQEVQAAAEAFYDRTPACRFTTFVGYEYTLSPDSANLHRNVLFRNAVVPALPTSAIDAPTPEALWRALREQCLEGLPGCDVLAIPHNSNLSAGTMFQLVRSDGVPFDADYAATRAKLEPLVEIVQHKGDSECLPGETNDELCSFEKLSFDRFGGKFRDDMRFTPAPTNFVRRALRQGLAVESVIGVNPFKFGIVGGTDTHIGAGGLVDEAGHPGHGGAIEIRDLDPKVALPDDIEFNPGGLAVMWAEENSRDALFAAMRRREVYGTSGPRLVVRFFGGWGFAPSTCEGDGPAAQGYANGVPMGGVLPPAPAGRQPMKPTFAVSALKDAGTKDRPGTQLQRIQIVKGWLSGEDTREAVYDVAGDPKTGASVDLATCTAKGTGFDSLCTTWTDPDFDPKVPAFYYARVVENPSCRWQTFACNAANVRCGNPEAVPPGLAPCCDPAIPKTIQERAWTSPIWYDPPR